MELVGVTRKIQDWRESSYSAGGGECAEVGSGFTNCIEAGHGDAVVGVRDTKQEHLGDQRTVLEFSPEVWREFITQLKE